MLHLIPCLIWILFKSLHALWTFLFLTWGGTKTFGVLLWAPVVFSRWILRRRQPGAKLASNGNHENYGYLYFVMCLYLYLVFKSSDLVVLTCYQVLGQRSDEYLVYFSHFILYPGSFQWMVP